MEKRKVKVMFQKSGSGSLSTRLAIPKKWVDEMGISVEDRNVAIEFDGETIIIKKMEEKKHED